MQLKQCKVSDNYRMGKILAQGEVRMPRARRVSTHAALASEGDPPTLSLLLNTHRRRIS